MVHHLLSCVPYVSTSAFRLKIIILFIVLYGHKTCPRPLTEGTEGDRERSSGLREVWLILGLFNSTLPTDYLNHTKENGSFIRSAERLQKATVMAYFSLVSGRNKHETGKPSCLQEKFLENHAIIWFIVCNFNNIRQDEM
jgi:hypothetical protein